MSVANLNIYLLSPQAFSRSQSLQAEQFHKHPPSKPAAERPERLQPFGVETGWTF